jgi:hypothetical protein
VVAGGWYLRDNLDPATPPPLAAAIQHLARVLLDHGANYLAGTTDADPHQATLKSDANSAFARVAELCK